jgi:hypothetical protein
VRKAAEAAEYTAPSETQCLLQIVLSLLKGLLPGFLGLRLTCLGLLLNGGGFAAVSGDDVILCRDFTFVPYFTGGSILIFGP